MKYLTRERISVEPFRSRWSVSWRLGGKLTRKLFETKKEAGLFADSIRPAAAKRAPKSKRP